MTRFLWLLVWGWFDDVGGTRKGRIEVMSWDACDVKLWVAPRKIESVWCLARDCANE
jgi:hypothetical protein